MVISKEEHYVPVLVLVLFRLKLLSPLEPRGVLEKRHSTSTGFYNLYRHGRMGRIKYTICPYDGT